MSKPEKQHPFLTRDAFLNYARQHNESFIVKTKAAGRYVNYAFARGESCPTGRVNEHGQPIYGRGAPEGVFLAWQDEDSQLRFAWSMRHPEKEPKSFSRVEGVYRAIRRGEQEVDHFTIYRSVPGRHKSAFFQFIDETAKYLLEREQFLRMTIAGCQKCDDNDVK